MSQDKRDFLYTPDPDKPVLRRRYPWIGLCCAIVLLVGWATNHHKAESASVVTAPQVVAPADAAQDPDAYNPATGKTYGDEARERVTDSDSDGIVDAEDSDPWGVQAQSNCESAGGTEKGC